MNIKKIQQMLHDSSERSKKRKDERIFLSLIELIQILCIDYFKETAATSIDLIGPFGGTLKMGLFDNTKKKIQLKVSTNGRDEGIDGVGYPGTNVKGQSWAEYGTWTLRLDRIDGPNRDYTPRDWNNFPNIKKLSNTKKRISLNAIKDMGAYNDLLQVVDELKDDGGESAYLDRLEQIMQDVIESNIIKADLANYLLKCLEWCPDPNEFTYQQESEIPSILNQQLRIMKKELHIPDLEAEQARAADSLFFVAVCEDFRVPAAVKYIRACLRFLIENNLTFSEVFNTDKDQTLCTLSPKGGTQATRDCMEKGSLKQLSKEQRKVYETLSNASESEGLSESDVEEYNDDSDCSTGSSSCS